MGLPKAECAFCGPGCFAPEGSTQLLGSEGLRAAPSPQPSAQVLCLPLEGRQIWKDRIERISSEILMIDIER